MTRPLALLALWALAPWPAAAEPVEITEWAVPWEHTRPRDPYVDGEGRVWFVGQGGHYVAYLEPQEGRFRRYDLEPGTGPHNLIAGADGAVWYAGNRAAHIGRLDPQDGTIRKYAMPDPAAADPHTLVFDGRGAIWFTVQAGNFVGVLDPASGRIRLRRVPTPRARPYGIVAGAGGRPWFAEFGSHKIGTIDPQTLEIREYPLPREAARPRRLALAGGGVWYVDHAGGRLGRLDPDSGEVREWPLPGGENARPYGMAADHRGRLWLVETGRVPNRLVGFDPRSEAFFGMTPIPSGGSSVRHMVFHRPSRELWFGTDMDTVGRARVPD